MNLKDYYKILGVNEHATKEQIKKAFRRLARRFHPDVNPDEQKSGEKFKEINKAYVILCDDERRKMYDNIREVEKNPSAYQYGKGFIGSKRTWVYKTPKKQSRRSSEHESVEEIKFTRYPKNSQWQERKTDFFNDLKNVYDVSLKKTSSARTRTTRGPINGDDLRYDMEITFMESFRGGERQFRHEDLTTGEKKLLFIRFSKGAKEGQKLRLEGKGMPGENGGKPGDLYVVLHIKEHPIFKIKGDDVQIVREIPFTTSILGGEIKVPGITRDIIIKVPLRTKDSTNLRVKNKGHYKANSDQRGDLLIKVKIKIPDQINEIQKEMLFNLRELGL